MMYYIELVFLRSNSVINYREIMKYILDVAQPAFVIARFSFLEAMRNRLFLLALAGIICVLGLAEFVSELAITESRQIVSSMLSALIRLFCVFIIGLFVITSVVREFNDKGFDYILALPHSRYVYYLGKLLGFSLLSVVVVLCVSLIMLVYATPLAVLIWCLSLTLELMLVVALSLLFVFTFRQITAAFSAVVAFYLLARAMQTIQLISEAPILETNTISQHFMNNLLDLIGLILPRLDLFARTEWLVYTSVDFSVLSSNVVQAVIYILFLSACSAFDLYRMEL